MSREFAKFRYVENVKARTFGRFWTYEELFQSLGEPRPETFFYKPTHDGRFALVFGGGIKLSEDYGWIYWDCFGLNDVLVPTLSRIASQAFPSEEAPLEFSAIRQEAVDSLFTLTVKTRCFGFRWIREDENGRDWILFPCLRHLKLTEEKG